MAVRFARILPLFRDHNTYPLLKYGPLWKKYHKILRKEGKKAFMRDRMSRHLDAFLDSSRRRHLTEMENEVEFMMIKRMAKDQSNVPTKSTQG